MKSATLKISFLLLLSLSIQSVRVMGQFEQKLTLQTSGGFVGAISPESFTDIFNAGFSLDAGVQYNFSRSISIVTMAKYSTLFFTPDDEFTLESAKYNMLGLSACPKIRFLAKKRVNPYIFGGASINYISISFSLDGNETRKSKTPTSIGFIGGIGIDYRLNDNLSLFWQGGVSRVDLDVVWIDSFFQQAGVNINMFKAKTL